MSLLKACVNGIAKSIPVHVLRKIEETAQKHLGKGSGAWSTAEEAFAVSKLIENFNVENVIAVDVGANIGEWSAEFIALMPTAQIYAFEPSKSAFTKLEEKFHGSANVRYFNLALGKHKSQAILYSDKSGSGLGSLTKRRLDHFGIPFTHEEEVDVQTLDDFFSANYSDVKPTVLKMDVEGHELDVLAGARKTLENIRLVQFEFGGSNIDTKTYFQDFWYFFQDLNFEIYRLSPSGLIQISEYLEQDETFKATNYIALRVI